MWEYWGNTNKYTIYIRDKYLKKFRGSGYLSYSGGGDKYWYAQKDVDNFLKRFHYNAFAGTGPLSL